MAATPYQCATFYIKCIIFFATTVIFFLHSARNFLYLTRELVLRASQIIAISNTTVTDLISSAGSFKFIWACFNGYFMLHIKPNVNFTFRPLCADGAVATTSAAVATPPPLMQWQSIAFFHRCGFTLSANQFGQAFQDNKNKTQFNPLCNDIRFQNTKNKNSGYNQP